MSIHDDARTAAHQVYDTALAAAADATARAEHERTEAVAEANRIAAELGAVHADLIQAHAGHATTREQLAAALVRIAELEAQIPTPADPHAALKPKSFATWQDAVAELGLPTDAAYVLWDHGDAHLEAVVSRMPAGSVLVLPERFDTFGRPVPYLIDSSRGFIAAGVRDMEYLSDADYATHGYSAKVVTGKVPVDSSSSRLWFSMTRVQRGILGLGPGAVVKLTDSGYKGQRQPKSSMGVTHTNGSTALKVGVQQKIIEAAHTDAIFANFKLEGGVDLGTIAYSGIGVGKGTTTIRRLWIDRAWHGFAGIPNGEAGALGIGARYDIDGLLLTTDEHSSSPIMFNRSTGGRARNVWIGEHSIGMVTQWKSSGIHEWENFTTHAGTTGLNLEECVGDFDLRWEGGAMSAAAAPATKHLNINPSGGPIKVALRDVDVTTTSGLAPGKLVAHAYGTTGQRRDTLTWDGGAIAYLPTKLYI